MEPGGHRVTAQVWGPDPLTVAAIASIDTMWGLGMAGAGADWSLRAGLSGMNEGGTAYGGELGPLQAFGGPSQGTAAASRLDTTFGLPYSTGPDTGGPTTIRAMFADLPS